ncbi:MAG TPA: hypothetical protein GXX35_15845 [Thermoanaerobacterales bacterium]|nr:hypothetical protein [Thermoanaerobacterales bacterium]
MVIIEKYREIIERILELLNTMEEGLEFIQIGLSELKYEEAQIVLKDVIDAVHSIDSSIQPMQSGLPQNNISTLSSLLKKSLDKALERFDQNNELNINSLLENETYPAFKSWREEIEKVLRPYILS